MRVLIVDDSAVDAELCVMALRRAGTIFETVLVENEAQLRAALLTVVPDIVLCDFSFPHFDGLAAQRIVREAYPACPLIFISGTISEERIATALQSGAVDYVMKASLVRLPIAVERAVATARLAAHIEASAKRHLQRLETLLRIVNDSAKTGAALGRDMLCQAAIDLSALQRFDAYLWPARAFAPLVESSHERVEPQRSGLIRAAYEALSDPAFATGRRIRSWVDVARADDVPAELAAAGWRALICTYFESNGATYWLVFASPQAATFDFSEDDFAYVNVLASSFANHLQVDALQDSLRDEEERSRQHAQRLEALWQIVNDASLAHSDKWLAMLSQAAKSIWPGRGYRGMLWRIAGPVMTLEAVADSPQHHLPLEPMHVGTRLPVTDSIIHTVLARGGTTRSWIDVQTSAPELPLAIAQGVRSGIATTFDAGGATWALLFVSGLIAEKPLALQEHAYVEILAAFFSNRLQQRWQFETIQYQQSHDVLTRLLSRAEFRSQASEAARSSATFAIIVLDINAFHEINESYGHAIGDSVLLKVGTALAKCVEPDEIVGRLGGDVFAVYLANPPSRRSVADRARDIANVFARSFRIDDSNGGLVVTRSASIGVAVAVEDGHEIDAILSNADVALATAKSRGHGSIVFYEPGMERDAQRRATLRNELTGAIAGDQFTLYYQPHIEIATGRVTGCEALIRWIHPQRGLVYPDDFIPFAEQTGIIGGIDTWVMRNAFATAKELAASRPGFRLFFNLSGRRAGDKRIVRAFVEAARNGVPLRNLGVEITETDAMRDVAASHRIFRALRRLDVRAAIDDFGTGYSSLSSLKALSVDVVKIDRSFISGVTTNADDAAIAKTIISLADHFGLDSIGEGTETEQEVEWLRRHGCRYAQGYAFCRPIPLDAFKTWLLDYETRAATTATDLSTR